MAMVIPSRGVVAQQQQQNISSSRQRYIEERQKARGERIQQREGINKTTASVKQQAEQYAKEVNSSGKTKVDVEESNSTVTYVVRQYAKTTDYAGPKPDVYSYIPLRTWKINKATGKVVEYQENTPFQRYGSTSFQRTKQVLYNKTTGEPEQEFRTSIDAQGYITSNRAIDYVNQTERYSEERDPLREKKASVQKEEKSDIKYYYNPKTGKVTYRAGDSKPPKGAVEISKSAFSKGGSAAKVEAMAFGGIKPVTKTEEKQVTKYLLDNPEVARQQVDVTQDWLQRYETTAMQIIGKRKQSLEAKGKQVFLQPQTSKAYIQSGKAFSKYGTDVGQEVEVAPGRVALLYPEKRTPETLEIFQEIGLGKRFGKEEPMQVTYSMFDTRPYEINILQTEEQSKKQLGGRYEQFKAIGTQEKGKELAKTLERKRSEAETFLSMGLSGGELYTFKQLGESKKQLAFVFVEESFIPITKEYIIPPLELIGVNKIFEREGKIAEFTGVGAKVTEFKESTKEKGLQSISLTGEGVSEFNKLYDIEAQKSKQQKQEKKTYTTDYGEDLQATHNIEEDVSINKLFGATKKVAVGGLGTLVYGTGYVGGQILESAVQKPVTTVLAYVVGGAVFKWGSNVLTKGTSIVFPKSSIATTIAKRTAFTTGVVGLSALNVIQQPTAEEKILVVGGEIGIAGLFLAGQKTFSWAKSKFFENEKYLLEADIPSKTEVQIERTQVVGKKTTARGFTIEPDITYTVQGKRVTPETYAYMMQSKGKIKVSRPKYIIDEEGYLVLGQFSPVSQELDVSLIQSARREKVYTGKRGRPKEKDIPLFATSETTQETFAHELIHSKTPDVILSLGEDLLPYRLQPAEVIAFGLEKRYAKVGFAITSEDLTTYIGKESSNILLKKGEGFTKEYPRVMGRDDLFIKKTKGTAEGLPLTEDLLKTKTKETGDFNVNKYLDEIKFSVRPGEAEKQALRSTKKGLDIISTKGKVIRGGKEYDVFSVSIGRDTYTTMFSPEESLLIQPGIKGKLQVTKFDIKGKEVGTFAVTPTKEKTLFKRGSIDISEKDKALTLGKVYKQGGTEFSDVKSIKKAQQVLAVGQETDVVGSRLVKKKFRGTVQSELLQEAKATPKKETTIFGQPLKEKLTYSLDVGEEPAKQISRVGVTQKKYQNLIEQTFAEGDLLKPLGRRKLKEVTRSDLYFVEYEPTYPENVKKFYPPEAEPRGKDTFKTVEKITKQPDIFQTKVTKTKGTVTLEVEKFGMGAALKQKALDIKSKVVEKVSKFELGGKKVESEGLKQLRKNLAKEVQRRQKPIVVEELPSKPSTKSKGSLDWVKTKQEKELAYIAEESLKLEQIPKGEETVKVPVKIGKLPNINLQEKALPSLENVYSQLEAGGKFVTPFQKPGEVAKAVGFLSPVKIAREIKLKTKPVSDTRIEVKPTAITRTELKSFVRVEPKVKTDIKTDLFSKAKVDTRLKIETKAETKTRSEVVTRVATKVKAETKIKTETKAETKAKTKILVETPSKVITRERIEITERTRPFKFTSEEKPSEPLFETKVRRRGMFRTIGRSRSLKQAILKGKFEVERTAAASFKVIGGEPAQVKRAAWSILPTTKYRPSKKESDIFVQRREQRIKTGGEKFEITRKGQLALQLKAKRKKGKNLFNIFG